MREARGEDWERLHANRLAQMPDSIQLQSEIFVNPSDMHTFLRYKPKWRKIGRVVINIQLKTKTERKGKKFMSKLNLTTDTSYNRYNFYTRTDSSTNYTGASFPF